MTNARCSSHNNIEDEMYDRWKKSFVKSVFDEKNLLDYQKKNLIKISQNISLKNFTDLKNTWIKYQKNRKVNKEFYLLEHAEGEVVTAYMYYMVDFYDGYQVFYLNILDEGRNVKKLNKNNSEIEKMLNFRSINNDNLYRKLFVLTTFSNNNVSSTIGVE